MSDSNQPGIGEYRLIRPESVEWQPFAGFPTAARLAILVGDPIQAGPYVIRVSVPAGERMQPYRHSGDRIYTVLSGVFYIGVGEQFDEAKLTACGPGSLAVVPRSLAHFHWAKSGGYVVQISGIGPVALSYVNPHDDPRRG